MSRHFGVGLEGTYGTAATITDFSEAVSETLQTQREFDTVQTIRSNAPQFVSERTAQVSGDVTVAGNFEDLGPLLHAFFGAHTTAGTQAPYTHSFPGTAGTTGRSGVSYTLEVKRDTATRTFRYAGCKCVGMTFSASTGQQPQFVFSWIGKSEASGTATTASFPTFDPLLISQISVTFSGETLNATDVSIACAWPVDAPFTMGSTAFAAEPADNDVLSVTAEISVIGDDADMAEYAYFDGTTEVDVAIAATGTTNSITFNLNKCRITAAPGNISGRERMSRSYSLISYYNTAATENIEVVLVNSDAIIPS